MKDRVITTIVSYLDTADKFRLRQAHPFWQETLRNHQAGYENHYDMVIGVSGLLRTKEALECARRIYFTTKLSPSIQPAVLYKVYQYHDMVDSHKFKTLAQSEGMVESGRQYSFMFHFLPGNQMWVYTNILKGRPFVVFPTFNDSTVFLQHKPGYSAFAMEVAIAIKAGYVLQVSAAGEVMLVPTRDPRYLTYADCLLSVDEIKKAFDNVYRQLANIARADAVFTIMLDAEPGRRSEHFSEMTRHLAQLDSALKIQVFVERFNFRKSSFERIVGRSRRYLQLPFLDEVMTKAELRDVLCQAYIASAEGYVRDMKRIVTLLDSPEDGPALADIPAAPVVVAPEPADISAAPVAVAPTLADELAVVDEVDYADERRQDFVEAMCKTLVRDEAVTYPFRLFNVGVGTGIFKAVRNAIANKIIAAISNNVKNCELTQQEFQAVIT